MHEPKNRVAEELPFPEIRVDHAGGSEKTDPNGLFGCVIWATEGRRPIGADGEPVDYPGLFNPLDLKPLEGQVSAISGEPAVVYRADDVVIPLTPRELLRFLAHALRPKEFFAIRDRYGSFFEIHDDFYNASSGMTYQPMIDDPSDEAAPSFRKLAV
jgi:hypothetical protein